METTQVTDALSKAWRVPGAVAKLPPAEAATKVEPTWTFADYIERDNRAVQTESKLPGLYECVFR